MTQIEQKNLLIGAGLLAFVSYILGAKHILDVRTKMCTDANYTSKNASLQAECPNISASEMIDYYYVPTVPIIGDFTKGFLVGAMKVYGK